MKKKWLMYALVGGAVYWFFLRNRGGAGLRLPSAMPVLPTDSMAPGSLGPAVQGLLKEGTDLVQMY
jgi:hypothetical protein